MPSQNSSWIMGLRRKTKPDSSEFIANSISSGTKSRIDRDYNDIKYASNTKANHIMVSSMIFIN